MRSNPSSYRHMLPALLLPFLLIAVLLLPLHSLSQCTAPVLVLKPTPAPVCTPHTVDLTSLVDYSASVFAPATYIIYLDGADNPVADPTAVSIGGVYKLQA